MGRGRLMAQQKQAVIELVGSQGGQGRTVGKVLESVGVARSSYYRWKKSEHGEKSTSRQSSYEITAEERALIDEVKEQNPQYRHRRIQGILQQQGIYLSASTIYGHLKQQGQIEPYERRAAPWKSPRYEVWQRNQMWGSDWTKLRVGGVRWYLLTVIDFFSRWIVAWEVVPRVHAGTIKAIYQAGLNNQGISLSQSKPELRVDRGSPNTSGITQEFFEALGAELSFARVRRPTDNALTERFYGTIKQEEIYLVGNYPDEISAKEEIGRYMERYHHSRPHQSLMNFTPAHVHEVNNKSRLLVEIKEMKRKTRAMRKEYWEQQRNPGSTPAAGGCPSQGPARSVNPGANTEAVFQQQHTDSQIESPTTENFSLVYRFLSH